MKYSILVKESARNNITEAFLYYERKQEGLGERFLRAWERHLEFLQQEPNLYQKKYKDFRQVIIRPYPYHIIYELEEQVIVVYKVIYAGRHPRKRYTHK
jgi:plasmid stabilization system protein ParE